MKLGPLLIYRTKKKLHFDNVSKPKYYMSQNQTSLQHWGEKTPKLPELRKNLAVVELFEVTPRAEASVKSSS